MEYFPCLREIYITTSNSELNYTIVRVETLASALVNGLGTLYLRIGLAHTSHMCLESPSHHVMYGYKIDFWDRHYFIKYDFFWKRYHSMFYLIIRRKTNMFWPRLSSKTKKGDFLENGAKHENLKLKFWWKKYFSFIWSKNLHVW